MLIVLLDPSGGKIKKHGMEKFRGTAIIFIFSISFIVLGIVFYKISGSFFPAIICCGIGLVVLIPNLFVRKKILSLRVARIDHAGLGNVYRIILVDDSVDEDSFKALISKYYIYETIYGEKFEVDVKYKIDIYKYSIVASTCYLEGNTQARILANFNDEDFVEDYLVNGEVY